MIPCNQCKKSAPKELGSSDTTPDLSQNGTFTTKIESLKRSYDYSDDDTLDSELEGQKVVKFSEVVERRKLRRKMTNSEQYNSSDSDSTYRHWSIPRSSNLSELRSQDVDILKDFEREGNSSPEIF